MCWPVRTLHDCGGVYYKVRRITFGSPVSPSVIQYQSLSCWTDFEKFCFECLRWNVSCTSSLVTVLIHNPNLRKTVVARSAIIYRIFLLSPLRARQLLWLKTMCQPVNSVTVAVLRTAINETFYIEIVITASWSVDVFPEIKYEIIYHKFIVLTFFKTSSLRVTNAGGWTPLHKLLYPVWTKNA
jgi:hypothetical protein